MWKSKEVDYLLANVETLHLSEIASVLGKTEKAVRNKAERLGISFRRLQKYSSLWTKKECEFLISNINMPLKEISNTINRTIGAITYKKKELGLSKKYLGFHIEKRDGYVVVWQNDKKTTRRYHRVVMENHIGRELLTEEVVHHIDEDKLNNHITNLIITDYSEHRRFHTEINNIKKSGRTINFNRQKREYYAS